jgi:hypothetical protein
LYSQQQMMRHKFQQRKCFPSLLHVCMCVCVCVFENVLREMFWMKDMESRLLKTKHPKLVVPSIPRLRAYIKTSAFYYACFIIPSYAFLPSCNSPPFGVGTWEERFALTGYADHLLYKEDLRKIEY